MKDGRCPMCKSTEVYVNESFHFFLRLQGPVGTENIMADLDPYVCKNCGFTALFAKDPHEHLEGLPAKNGWKPVS